MHLVSDAEFLFFEPAKFAEARNGSDPRIGLARGFNGLNLAVACGDDMIIGGAAEEFLHEPVKAAGILKSGLPLRFSQVIP